MAQVDFFQRLYPEIIVKIYGHMSDLGDVKATLSTCKKAKGIFEEHVNTIAKAHILQILGPQDYKFAVMAVASREVDPTDQSSVEGFFRKYLETEKWPASYFTMNIANTLPLLQSYADFLTEYAFNTWIPYSDMNENEYTRQINTMFMVETAVNLFHKMPGDGQDFDFFWRAPLEEWEEKYWFMFSACELGQVVHVGFQFFEVLHYAVNEQHSCRCRLCVACDYGLPNHLNANNDVRRDPIPAALAYCVGLDELFHWARYGNPCLRINGMYEELHEALSNNDAEVKRHCLIGVAEHCMKMQDPLRGRFRPDSQAIDEVTWLSFMADNGKGFSNFFACSGAGDDFAGGVACWDMSTVMEWGEWMRRMG
ncbi:hypothetical protein K449DRAFT_463390 [Hypoxylon sp. EC38]|nr:hypothetical protein K449DRAFT_463390 [Hypoxylon sp. EC38]